MLNTSPPGPIVITIRPRTVNWNIPWFKARGIEFEVQFGTPRAPRWHFEGGPCWSLGIHWWIFGFFARCHKVW